ncbi:entry exclusion lipoprotein TrbK [Salinisphaera sp. SWV1]|uniref:entry exclusion lipoprotein TrbK n=1 Tax=Salinisphaera sp. SWV1 TaxID=3454139 RepID=UPI003F836AA8
MEILQAAQDHSGPVVIADSSRGRTDDLEGMLMKHWLTFIALVAVMVTTTAIACSKHEHSGDKRTEASLPPVNDQNCQTSEIKKIEPLKLRQKFADKCFTRGTYVHGPVKSWKAGE